MNTQTSTFKLFSAERVEIDGLTKIDEIRFGDLFKQYYTGPADFDVEALEADGLYLKRL
jgi:hypothetical protein